MFLPSLFLELTYRNLKVVTPVFDILFLESVNAYPSPSFLSNELFSDSLPDEFVNSMSHLGQP